MSSDAVEDEAVADGPKAQPPAEVVAAALEESRLEARLLRVSSSLFLKEAKEYIEGGKASVLLWAGNCLEVGNEGDKAKLQDVRACSEATGVPVVTVEDTKKLGEWVGLGKIGRRRASTCLLAVVLDTEGGDDAPALAALLRVLPKGAKPKERPATAAATPAPAAAKAPSTASSMNTHAKHSYVPATPKLKAAALTGKDKLPVLRSTGSYTPSSRRVSGDGSGPSTPAWVAQRQGAGASSTPAKSAKPGALAASSKLDAADKQPAAAAAQPPSNGPASGALADCEATPQEPAVGTPPQTRAKAPVASEQSPEGAAQASVARPAQVPEGQVKAPATHAQPKGVAAAAEEPPAADTGSTVPQKTAPAGAGTAGTGSVGATPSKLENGEAASLPKAAGAADSGEPPAAKDLSIPPTAYGEAGADAANGDLPSPAQDVGIWDRLPATSLQPAKASGDSSSSPSGSKENIPMQVPAAATPAQASVKGQKLAEEPLTPGAGAASKGSSASKPADGPAESTPAPVALPSEVSSFRMERRKRGATAPPTVEPPATPATGSGEGTGDAL